MRASLNGLGQNNFLTTNKITQNIAKQGMATKQNQLGQAGRRDKGIISPQGKATNMLENLFKQKLGITEQKNALISDTLEKGGSMESIKTQLETYELQLKSLDEQIAGLMTNELEKNTQSKNPTQDTQPKTEKEAEEKRLADLTNLASNIGQTQVVASVKNKVDGQARVIKAELKLDNMSSLPSSSSKAAKLAQLEAKSQELAGNIGKTLADAAEELASINKPTQAPPQEEEQPTTAE